MGEIFPEEIFKFAIIFINYLIIGMIINTNIWFPPKIRSSSPLSENHFILFFTENSIIKNFFINFPHISKHENGFYPWFWPCRINRCN